MAADPPFDLEQVDRLLTTTKSVRRRLDLGRPVERSVIAECIRLASFAPNASNAQEWHWVVVDDPDLRVRVGDLYRRILEPLSIEMLAAKLEQGDEAGARVTRSVLYLAEHMRDVPAMVIPCYDVGAATSRYGGCCLAGRADEHAAGDVRVDPAGGVELSAGAAKPGPRFDPDDGAPVRQDTMADILGIPKTWFQVALLPVAYTTRR